MQSGTLWARNKYDMNFTLLYIISRLNLKCSCWSRCSAPRGLLCTWRNPTPKRDGARPWSGMLRCRPLSKRRIISNKAERIILLRNDTPLSVNQFGRCNFTRSLLQACQRSQRSMGWRSRRWRATTSLSPAWLRAASPPPTCAGSGTKRRSKVCHICVYTSLLWVCDV